MSGHYMMKKFSPCRRGSNSWARCWWLGAWGGRMWGVWTNVGVEEGVGEFVADVGGSKLGLGVTVWVPFLDFQIFYFSFIYHLSILPRICYVYTVFILLRFIPSVHSHKQTYASQSESQKCVSLTFLLFLLAYKW